MHPSITALSKYLRDRDAVNPVTFTSNDERNDDHIPAWKGPTCLNVVSYVLKLSGSHYNDALIKLIVRLEDLALDYRIKSTRCWWYVQMDEIQRQISDIFVNSFMPMAKQFFKVEMQRLCCENYTDHGPKIYESLAGFLGFLVEILNSEADDHWIDLEEDKDRFAPLRREMVFLVAVLGDVPFHECVELEEAESLLKGFEDVGNEAGGFVYSYVFATCPVNEGRFSAGMSGLLGRIEVLNGRIQDFCVRFSKITFVNASTFRNVNVDSLFVVDSFLEDLESLMCECSVCLVDDVKDKIGIIHEKLISVKSFMKDFRSVQDLDSDELKECVFQIINVVYEAEYLIKSFVIGNLPIWYPSVRLPNIIQKFEVLGEDLEMKEVEKNFDNGVLQEMVEELDGEISAQTIANPIPIVDDVVVGFEDETLCILDELTGGSESLQIITICGMPGLGKTTLAKALYNHSTVNYHFDEHAWCVVSQTYFKKRLLVDILMCLASKQNHVDIFEMDDDDLALKIHKSLKGRRYLIVVDDVWDLDAWSDFRRYFPDDRNGSRIIITTRITDLSLGSSIVHKLPFLSHAQCWELLERKVFCEEHCPPHLLDIGKKIASKCGGVPLAVVVVAGILTDIEKKESEWRNVEGSLDSYLFANSSSCMNILELSYKHLPDYLKPCFLYFGAFPEDAEIPAWKLIWLWIAEGFVSNEGEKSLEKVAEEYLTDLINRNLVLTAKNKCGGGVKACSIHDLLRELCLRTAHEENFLKSIKDLYSIYETHHRLCVPSTFENFSAPFGLHCRSFLGHLSDPISWFPKMKFLKVLNLSSVTYYTYEELKGIQNLVFLKFLLVHLKFSMSVDQMPEIIGSLRHLEFLRVDYLGGTVFISSVVLKLPKLRHISLESEAKFADNCEISFQTNNLRTLSLICIDNHKDEEILKSSPFLRKLKCKCEKLFPNLSFLHELESLKLEFHSPFSGEVTESNFPQNIRKLALSGLRLPWEKMSVLGRLPNLQVLKLGHEAFVGEEWESIEGEFLELRYLELQGNLQRWIASSEHFPKLQHLVLLQCHELQEIPSEIGNIPTLEKIELHSSSYEANISAFRIKEEQEEYGNEDLKVITTRKRWLEEHLALVFKEVNI